MIQKAATVAKMETEIRAAIVGCGSIAQVHAACLDRQKGIKLTSVCDIRKERAEEIARRYGAKVYTSLEEMLREEDLQVLHICTPHYLHVPMAEAALTKGMHVFMEKPPAMSYEEYAGLKEAAGTSKGQLGLCFQNRYNPGTLQAAELMKHGIPGKVIGGRALVSWSRNKEYYTESGWRGSLKTEGGGVLINQAVHSLDLLTLFLGKPVKADAVMANHHLKGIIEVEDMMEAYIQYENGVKGCFYATTAYCTNMPPIIELHCENMNLRIEEMRTACFDFEGREIDTGKFPVSLAKQKESMGKSYWGAGHQDCITDYYQALKEGKKVPLGIEQIKDTVGLMLAIYESARNGKEVIL
ncbi:Gfo/Idh/MocA family protein [Anaerocolumna xylanovorans]|uniref:Predicted dehydrogenase n=1 Tax=Anaerocolumna xylanovorans DSM 12503 TaxID=1121345 RepID=A0A1M7YG03_9FIRM|nr:Gfo/Idh/MocA family oxidoreductase [Anaerocolumna xylanovorans]SHO51516.1 Predicted dehydrogenase [Anaerocolumna xylanovorans DSM 12503]